MSALKFFMMMLAYDAAKPAVLPLMAFTFNDTDALFSLMNVFSKCAGICKMMSALFFSTAQRFFI